jgi:hypothetical protein
MDHIAESLGMTPIPTVLLQEIDSHVQQIKNTTEIPKIGFCSPIMIPFLREQGKVSYLVTKWNGSEEQKRFLRDTLKGRNITWGEEITKAKSDGPYQIIMNNVSYTTLSINKFAKEHGLNTSSMRLSLKNSKSVQSKGRTVMVSKV